MRHQRLDRVEDRIDRAVAGRTASVTCSPSMSSVSVAVCGPCVPAITVSDTHLDAVLRVRDLLVDQRLDVLVVDLLLAVGERLEAHEGVFELVAGELVAELLQLVHEGVAAGVLAHHQRGLLHADASPAS